MEEFSFSAAAAGVLLAVAQALMPSPESSISAWVDEGKVILTEKTNTPKPGPFRFEGVELIREPLDLLHEDDPSRRITVVGGAQSAKSSIGQLWVARSIDVNPKSFAIGLPSAGEVRKYNDYKLQPIIEDSPSLAPKVRPVSTKSSLGSTASKKKLFNGASILVFNLGSFNELQMISTGNLILEEVANTEKEVGSRGSPIKQARERQAAYSVLGSKELMVSTPGILGECEVTKAYEVGDRRHFYGKCHDCAGYFVLLPEEFKAAADGCGPHFICPGCGTITEEVHSAYFRVSGLFAPTFTAEDAQGNPAPKPYIESLKELELFRARPRGGREPSFWWWQANCGLISWASIAEKVATAKTPDEIKALHQQCYGRAWDPAVEAMEWQELHRLREPYDHGTVPSGAELLTGACDVGGNYLQWTVYAWGPGGEWWVVDRDIITGDTNAKEVWTALDAVARKRYPHADGGELPIEAFAVDTGYRTQLVYAFCRGRPNCYAVDGRPDWRTPYFGKARPQRVIENGRVVGRVKLWPVGTWQLKSLLAWSLKRSVEATYQVRVQGRGHWTMAEGEAWTQEITAEVLYEEKNAKTGQVDRWWKKVRKNEETDIWVYARALSWMKGVGVPPKDGQPGERMDWTLAAAVRGAVPQGDFFQADAPKASAAQQRQIPVGPRPGGWFAHRKS